MKKLLFRFHKTLVNESAPSGSVDMYEVYEETGATFMSVAFDHGRINKEQHMQTICNAFNRQRGH